MPNISDNWRNLFYAPSFWERLTSGRIGQCVGSGVVGGAACCVAHPLSSVRQTVLYIPLQIQLDLTINSVYNTHDIFFKLV